LDRLSSNAEFFRLRAEVDLWLRRSFGFGFFSDGVNECERGFEGIAPPSKQLLRRRLSAAAFD
jgi:hypothetical protein